MELFVLLMMLFSAVLALLYTVVIVRTLSGSRFTFVIKIASLILMTNIASLLFWFMIFAFDSLTGLETGIAIFLVFISELSFGLAHWSLANKYYSVAQEIPQVL